MSYPGTLCVLRAFVVLSFLTVSARLSAADVPAIHWPPLLEHLTDHVWIDDEFPPGANLATNKDDHAITWVESPVKSGSKSMLREADGIGQHYFTRSDEPLYASPEDSLFFWIHPDAETPPKAIMLQIHTHTWGHRVNWGDEDAINYGKKGTPQKHLAGPLPEAGTWTRLEIELRDLGITNGTKINGLAFTIAGGRAFWDRAGIRTVYAQPYKRPVAVAPDTLNLGEKAERYIWFDDDLPPGAAARTSSGNHPLRWTEDEPLSGARAMEREGESVEQHYFEDCQRPLTIGPDDTLSTWVHLDPLNPPTAIMLEQILINLAVNARDAMNGPGTVSLTIEETELDADEAEVYPDAAPGHFVRLTVSDTGEGMDQATQARIFEPFFTTKDVGKGTGLGLSTVYGIIRQHHGWITVTSEPGRGTSFMIYLPLSEPEQPEDTDETPPDTELRGDEKILLVEDESSVRRITAAVLTRAGYDVVQAEDGVAALAEWEKQDGGFDLLLSDVLMPNNMNGVELAHRLFTKKPSLKVVLISGYSNHNIEASDLERMGAIFVNKPVAQNELLGRMRDLLDATPAVKS